MTLQEAWLKLIDMENYENLSPSQIYSILSDYGIFKENPKLRLVIKSALSYGLWELVFSTNSANSEIQIKNKLDNDGFSTEVINQLFNSFSTKVSQNENQNSRNLESDSIPDKIDKNILPFELKTWNNGQSTNFDNEIKFLNSIIKVIPSWNTEMNIEIDTLNITDKIVMPSFLSNFGSNYKEYFLKDGKKHYCLNYQVSADPNRYMSSSLFPKMVNLYIAIISTGERIHSMNYLTSLNLKDKYAISSGEYDLSIDISNNSIRSLVIIPETGDIDISNSNQQLDKIKNKKSPGIFEKFTLLKCPILFEDNPNLYQRLDIKLNNIVAWGYGTTFELSFLVEGLTKSQSGYRLGNFYVIALFDKNNKLVETFHIFIGKTGYIGPRGGLHDTFMLGGELKMIFIEYFETKININEISKIIVSPSN